MENRRAIERPRRTVGLFSTAVIRWMMGPVFLREAIRKCIQPGSRGTERFGKIELPAPEILGCSVGTTEILCGLPLAIGFYARADTIPMLTFLAVPLLFTKVPILLNDGNWEAAHAKRTDFSMPPGSVCILLRAAAWWSLDTRSCSVGESR